jgi:heat shock protein HtpX
MGLPRHAGVTHPHAGVFFGCGFAPVDALRTERPEPRRQTPAIAQLRRRLAREFHSHHSRRVLSGLVNLLDLCGQANGKSRGVRQALGEIQANLQAAERQPRATLRALGGRPLRCSEAPQLYAILLNICVRAGMERLPELFLLPVAGMNAYALGGPDNACISVTEGLLHGLSHEEIAGIFAHEVGHILHHDTGAMNLAAAIESEITHSALRGIAELTARGRDHATTAPLAMLLAAAPALARLLFLALSRVREFAADALALDLIDHPRSLAAALCKLEFFHTGLSPFHAHMREHADSHSWRTHPGTWERLSHLG